jgi:hypothetical protein
MARERMNEMRGITVNTSIVGHGAVRNGVVQTGAVALLLGMALAANGVHAAENVEREDNVARPAVPAPPAPPRAAVPAATPAVPAAPKGERRTAAEMAELETKLHDAQERLGRAAEEVAALASERAADAMESFAWSDKWPRRTILGVQLSPDGKDGAKVVDVSPFGPAELAGVRAGDVIVMLNDKDVKGESSREVLRLLRDVKPDSKVKLRVMRDGKPMDFEVVPRPVVANPFVNVVPPPGPDGDYRGSVGPFSFKFGPRSELNGLEVTTLTPQLGRYFGTEKGVLVVRAPKDDLLKLQDGDVIVSIDGREPLSGSHITRILSSYQPGEKVTLRVFRDRKAQDIVVTFPEGGQRLRRSNYEDRRIEVTPFGPLQSL